MIDTTKEYGDSQVTYIPTPESGCVSSYELHEGLVVIPILGDPEDTPVIARVHSAFTIRRVQFSYSKGAAPPLIPPPGGTTRSGYQFLSGKLSIAAPGGSAEGTLTYTASGFYNYVAPRHVTIDGKIMFDAHPFPSGVDRLGADNGSQGPADIETGGFYNTWKSQYFDLNILSSARILG